MRVLKKNILCKKASGARRWCVFIVCCKNQCILLHLLNHGHESRVNTTKHRLFKSISRLSIILNDAHAHCPMNQFFSLITIEQYFLYNIGACRISHEKSDVSILLRARQNYYYCAFQKKYIYIYRVSLHYSKVGPTFETGRRSPRDLYFFWNAQ